MSERNKRRWSVLLALTLLCTMLFGSTVSAARWHEGYSDVGNLVQGDFIDVSCVLGIPQDYTVTINGQRVTGSYVTMADSIVVSYEKDENNKTIDFVYEKLSEYRRLSANGAEGSAYYVKPGTQVTLKTSLPDNLKQASLGFRRWYVTSGKVNGWYADPSKAVDVGLNEEELSQETISFTMPDRDLYIYYEYGINTVSGNSWWFGHWSSDMEGLVPVEIEVEGSGSSGTASDSNQDGGQAEASEPTAERPNVIQRADGTTITSETQMQYVARSVQGVIPVTGKAAVDSAAGLTKQQIEDGTKAKFYIGDVYKKDVKKLLENCVQQAGGSLVSMLDMDLYTIGRDGVNAVKDTKEPVTMVIGLPQKHIKEGREFSLVYADADGRLAEIRDTDNDPGTITVDLTRFGAFAVIYK